MYVGDEKRKKVNGVIWEYMCLGDLMRGKIDIYYCK